MPKQTHDFNMTLSDKPVPLISDYILECEENGISFKSIRNQIITPMKTRFIGTYEMNKLIRNILNPSSISELGLPRYKWEDKLPVHVSIGDKVVCTENTYDMRDYRERYENWLDDYMPDVRSFIPTPESKIMLNGETGVITDILVDGSLEVDFGDRTVEIPAMYEEFWAKQDRLIDAQPLRSINLAYALTTHKAQGSEYDHIAYLINSSMFYLLSRQNFYTAVTRARKSVQIFTDQRGLQTAIRQTQRDIDLRNQKAKDKKKSLVKK